MTAARKAAVDIGNAEAAITKGLELNGKPALVEFLGVREIRKVANEPPLDLTEDRPAHGTALTRSTFEMYDFYAAKKLAQGEPVTVSFASTADYEIDPSEDPTERAERYSKRRESRGPLVSVGLYLHGSDLDPDQIAGILKTKPTGQHRKNDKHITSTGQVVIRKGGLWKILVKIDSPEINDHLQVLAEHAEPLLRVLREQVCRWISFRMLSKRMWTFSESRRACGSRHSRCPRRTPASWQNSGCR